MKTVAIFILVLLCWGIIGYMSGFDLTTRGKDMGWFTFLAFFVAFILAIFIPNSEDIS